VICICQVGVFTDPNVANTIAMKNVRSSCPYFKHEPLITGFASQAIQALEAESDLPFEVFDQVQCEPTEDSWRKAIAWARQHNFSHFLA
jgi:hydroxyacid-oxoacid transhydrogenase